MFPRRILVVEDDPNERDLLVMFLEDDGYEVERVANGREALTRLQLESRPYDLILCDLQMPEVDGVTLYGVLQRRPGPTPEFLFQTG